MRLRESCGSLLMALAANCVNEGAVNKSQYPSYRA